MQNTTKMIIIDWNGIVKIFPREKSIHKSWSYIYLWHYRYLRVLHEK